MRVWDIDPGYLNRQSLLGEHRELHGIVAILQQGKQGYARHPETLRWVGRGWALQQRHRLLQAEMTLRGYRDRTPVAWDEAPGCWPPCFIAPPGRQLQLLGEKYRDREPGRIPLPTSAQQLWSQHKYSVLARDPNRYRQIGHDLAGDNDPAAFGRLADELVGLLRTAPSPGGLRNALQHMWGHVAVHGEERSDTDPAAGAPLSLLQQIRRRAQAMPEPYLLASTALGELEAWL